MIYELSYYVKFDRVEDDSPGEVRKYWLEHCATQAEAVEKASRAARIEENSIKAQGHKNIRVASGFSTYAK